MEREHTIAVLRAALSSTVDLVLTMGTPVQIEALWAVLKVAEEEAQKVVPLKPKVVQEDLQ